MILANSHLRVKYFSLKELEKGYFGTRLAHTLWVMYSPGWRMKTAVQTNLVLLPSNQCLLPEHFPNIVYTTCGR